jgi:putative oxidoreductase
MGIGKLVLRLVIGSIFTVHGLQKLTGEFSGPGLAGTEKMMEANRMYPVRRNALFVSLGETLSGLGIILGLVTPLAVGVATATMATAVRKVHGKNGFANSKGGYEFNVTLVAAAAALVIDGPGPFSVDAVVGRSRWGLFWGVMAVVGGIVASSFAIEAGADAAPASTG